jgi:release factor glutamine methyltransferase
MLIPSKLNLKPVTLNDWLIAARSRLKISGDADYDCDPDWMACEALRISRGALKLRLTCDLTDSVRGIMDSWLARREIGEPLQYIPGSAHFMGLVFKCDSRALIPRQDTESLCEAVLNHIKTLASPSVLDLCAGSGAIGLAIKHARPDVDLTLIDIDADALALARENAEALSLNAKFYESDMFSTIKNTRFDVIVCNPPYLSGEDMERLPIELTAEPRAALYGGIDGLDFYRRASLDLGCQLTRRGAAFFEVGMGQVAAVAGLLRPIGCLTVGMDLRGIARVVSVKRAV